MIELPELHAIEQRAFNAWPALQTVFVGNCIFRISAGYTKRANSVNAAIPNASFTNAIAEAERVYARKNLPAIFRVTRLAAADADAELERHGYLTTDPSFVMVTSLRDTAKEQAVRIDEVVTNAWLDRSALAKSVDEHDRRTHDAMISSISMQAGFATLFESNEAVGFGFAVYERQAIGLFDIVVTQSHRGRGYGRSIVNALCEWGFRLGAGQAYLQVAERNAVARKLYASLGFKEAYRYHYRVRAK